MAHDIQPVGAEQQIGGNWVSDWAGNVITGPDGNPVDGAAVQDMVERSGMRLSNEEAARRVLAGNKFVDGVLDHLAHLRTEDEVAKRVTEYYDRDESEFPPADPDEMTVNIRDIIQAAKDKKVEG